MSASANCPGCGSALPADAPRGFCPACLLGLLESETDISPPPSNGGEGLRRVGDYELLEEISRGGMGVVFKARQRSLNRLVALKLLPAGALAQPESVRRFQAEASAAAALQHPNIVAIHEIGVQDDQHFIAMDLVDGPSLSRVVANGPLPPRRAAAYVKAIAEAVHYAHERGILHRDIKPSNVLLGADDQPRVTDFGLAKRFDPLTRAADALSPSEGERAGVRGHPSESDQSLLTSAATSDLTISGQLLGSPNYMPPEQAAATRAKVSRRSDVYGLGATLYHLLTGRAPFQASTLTEVLNQVATADPLAPRLLQPGVPADLETICLKCLEKEPAKRYATAQALADELGRFLHDEPIHARPVGRVEKAWRWCRRKPALAGLWVAGLLVLVSLFTGLSLAALRNAAVRKAEQREYFAAITLADNYVRIGDIQRALDVLTNCPPRFRHWEWGRLMYLCHQEIETIHTITNLQMAIVGGIDYTRLIVNSERTRLVTVGEDGAATVWELKTGAKLCSVGGATNRIIDMAFGPDGRTLALLGHVGNVEVWDANESRRLFGLVASNGPVRNVTFSGDGALVRVTTRDSASAWDNQTGRFVSAISTLPGHGRLAIDASGMRLATIDAQRKVHLWDAQTGQLLRTLDGRFSSQARLFLSPNGKRLLVADPSAAPSTVWNTDTRQELATLLTRVDSAAFNADGSRVATVSGDNVARVWSASSGREILSLKGHAAIVRFIAFSPDSTRITTVGEDGAVKLWRAELGREFTRAGGLIGSLAFSPDGKRLALGHDEHIATVWDIESGRHLLSFQGHLHRVDRLAFSADGKRLVTSSMDKTVRVWDAETARQQLILRGHSEVIYGVAISPDGRYVASCGDGIRVWDTTAGPKPRALWMNTNDFVFAVAFSPDGKQLATGGGDGPVFLWNHVTGEHLRRLEGHVERVLAIDYSPDGRMLATAGFDQRIQLWDPQSGKLLRTLLGHLKIYSAQFSPDGKRLLTVTSEHLPNSGHPSLQLWDVPTGRELIALEGHTVPLTKGVFSPDGRRVATSDTAGTVRVWETFPWRIEEYPGANDLPLAGRAGLLARDYWRQRLAADAWVSQRDNSDLFSQSPPIDRSEFPARAANISPNSIDLTEHYNGLLTVSWLPRRLIPLLASDLTSLPGGAVSFANIPFDVRGVIQLRAPSNSWLESGIPNLRQLPERIEGIPVGGKLAHLHALIGAVGKEPDGTPIASYVLHYADGQQRELPIHYGKHVRDWWNGADAREDISDGSLVWRGKTYLNYPWGGEIRVFVSRFENPRPGETVERIDFVSRLTGCGPFLIALTIEP